MAKSRKLEEFTTALHQIRDDLTSEVGIATLHQSLSCKYSIAVAQAAQWIGESELYEFVPDLVTAFDRFMINGKDSDPGCRAKQAIAEALYRLNYSDEALFLRGIRHVQPEPVWGGQVDTAPRLRGTCALGLVRMNYPWVMVELADLLADPESEARIGAARAIAYSELEQGVPLLRLRIQLGDINTVLFEYLIALLHLAPDTSLPLIKELLYARQTSGSSGSKEPGSKETLERSEAAALALAESRHVEAFSVLREWWQQVRQTELRQTGLLAIATLRQDQAMEFLFALLAEGRTDEAKAALKAISIYRQEKPLWQRVRQTLEDRGDQLLLQLLETS